MKTYENKEELKAEIKRAYDKYIAEFKDIPESLKDKQCMEVDRTPAQLIFAHGTHHATVKTKL